MSASERFMEAESPSKMVKDKDSEEICKQIINSIIEKAMVEKKMPEKKVEIINP